MAHYDAIFKNGTVVNHDGVRRADIGVRGERIAAISDLSAATAGETVDCRGLHILPGVIDTQVHFREPGLEQKEDLASGSLSAVMGGVIVYSDYNHMSKTFNTTLAPYLEPYLAEAVDRDE